MAADAVSAPFLRFSKPHVNRRTTIIATALSVLIFSTDALGGSPVRADAVDGIWTRVLQIPDIPHGYLGMFDSARDRLVVVEITNRGARTWAMDPKDIAWTILAEPELSTTTPGTRGVYDVAHDQALVILESQFPPIQNTVVQYSFSGAPGWHTIATGGNQLNYRAGFSVMLDQARNRVLVFGGVEYHYGDHGQLIGFTYFNDLDALSLTSHAWTILGTSGTPPSPRAFHAAAYDPVRDRMIVFGGTSDTEVWSLDLATLTWSHTSPTGGPSPSNPTSTMAYDPASDRMLLLGGSGRNELWELPLPAAISWNQLAPTGGPPTVRYDNAPVLLSDPSRDLLWLWNGAVMDYLWSLDVSGTPAWTNRSVPLPPECIGCVAVYDPDHNALVENMGVDSGDATWSLALGSAPTWTNLTPVGLPPPARHYHSGVFDPDGHRLVIWGGQSVGSATLLNDLWQLDLSGTPTWTQLAAAGTSPSAREQPSTTFDPLRRRMLVFGGYDGTQRNDVWQLSLDGAPAWTTLAPTGTPPNPQSGAPAVYDVARDRLLIVDTLHPGQVWALSAPPRSSGRRCQHRAPSRHPGIRSRFSIQCAIG